LRRRRAYGWAQLIQEEAMGWRLGIEARITVSMKQAQRERTAHRRLFEGKLSTILTAAFVLAMIVVLVQLIWQKTTQPSHPADYDGRIIDRWGDYSQSQQGSRPRFILLIESSDGKRFTMRVDATVFESSKVGMRIKSRAGQIVLIESEQGTNISK
jgi:hypothetical protein